MYNKYFTMKRSELKEAIKAEIKSVLTEEITEAKFIKFKGDSDDNKMEVEAEREMNTPDGELKVYTVKTDDGVQSYTADQVELVEEDLKEGKRGVVVDPDEIMMHINQYQSGNIDGDDLAQAIEEILVAMMNTPLNEEDEAPAGDKETEKAARGKDKVTIDFRNVMKKYNELKEKDKKEAVEYLKSNQDIVKKYKKAKEVNVWKVG